MSHTLYISVENVPPTKAGTTLLGASLTLLPGSIPIHDALAQPWHWSITRWTVYGSVDGTNWSPVAAAQVAVVPLPAADIPAGISPWQSALEQSISQIDHWSAAAPDPLSGPIVLKDDPTAPTPGEHKYLSLLANVAAGPYPVPQSLKLSFFLELTGIAAGVTQFIAAPTFTVNGTTFQPTSGLPTLIPSVIPVWQLSDQNSGITMMSKFSDPTSDFPMLWVHPPMQVGAIPFVSNWQAYIYEIVAPYLDLAHLLLATNEDDLAAILPDKSPQWPSFRQWVVASLYDLVTAGFPNVPGSKPTVASWYAELKNLPGLAKLIALDPTNMTSRTVSAEIDELQEIVSVVTSGDQLIPLVQKFYQASIGVVPQFLLKTGNGASLLSWLEVQSALPFAKSIADLCAATQQNFDGLATRLRDRVIVPYLVFRAVAPIGTGPSPLPAGTPIPAWVQSVSTLCVSNMQPALKKTLSVRALGNNGSTPAATTIAPPLVIPVMRMQSSDALSADPLHGIRGVAFLMRRLSAPAMDWSCLNIVSPVGDTSRPFLVASRPGYNQKLLTGFVVYDNGPLPCETLLHNYMGTADRLYSPIASIAPLMSYAPYEDVGKPLYGTPMLEAGRSYEVVSFAMSNAGAVPIELRDGYPAKLKPPHAGDSLPSGVGQAVPYFRTVPVGAAETRDPKGMPVTDSAGIFPRIPPNVWPRSIETNVPKVGVGLLSPGSNLTPAKPSTLFVVPSKSNGLNQNQGTSAAFTFSLKLPSIEPQTWDRSVGYLLDPDTRGSILDAAYTNLAKNSKAEITDPLIKQVDIYLYRWLDAKWGPPLGKATYSVDDLRKAASGIHSVETHALQVSVDAGTGVNDGTVRISVLSDLGERVSGTTKSVAATPLAEGEVFLLEATFTLDSSVGAIMQNYPKVVTGYQLLIEIASAAMPAPKDLVSPVFTVSSLAVKNVPDQRIQLQLKPDTASVWKNIHRVDFLRQTWYWTGRTQPQLPVKPSDPVNFKNDLSPGYYPAGQSVQSPQVQEWAKIEFAERSWTDHVELSSVLKDGVFSWDQDTSLDLRATYLRFAPRVYSRYQGAFLNLAPQGVTTIGNGGDDVWVPCFIHSRAQKLEMPRLKALIPLTESAFAPGTPGILAVFDGPAFDQAGLAERLHVSIAKVSDPLPTVTTAWTQAGPDFLMSNENPNPDPQNPDPKKQVSPTLLAIGPIGHTLDEPDSSFPEFISHSWIIRPVNPKDPDTLDHDFSWWFANLEFQLKVDDASSVFHGVDIASSSTIGSWIQFLPGFQSANHQSDLFDQWSLEWEGGAIAIRDDAGNLVTRGGSNERHLRHYLLVTRTVQDVTGRIREAYVGVAKQGGQSWVFFQDVPAFSPATTNIRGRFLDVRSGETGSLPPIDKPPATEAEFWRRILGDNTEISVDVNRASIVSLSPIIRQKGGLR